ncbi:pentapeptide repeat-containing protein [Bacillus safensis]|uniref:pentapeptide repeat-containing protein n=1 Tax=Bacillus safensis TaxID=561879 RepID=UPI002041594A|nr:pentapeptide repeat-containing protein [Bacillus safensis]MCM3138058.1 pentapeptide repeat-containing protein [Bacillus safensis]
MLSEELKLYVESCFRPYKKDKTYEERKKELLELLGNIKLKLENDGFKEEEVQDILIEKLKSGEISIDDHTLVIDDHNRVEHVKKIFVNDDLDWLTFINVKYKLCDFKGLSIVQKVMSHSEFNGCYLKKVNFSDSKISSATFEKSDLTQSHFEHCEITNSSLYGCHLPNVSIDESSLINVSFENCYFKNISFENSKLINVNFKSCTIKKLNFIGVTMDKMTYHILEGEGANLSGVEVIDM